MLPEIHIEKNILISLECVVKFKIIGKVYCDHEKQIYGHGGI